MSAATPLDPSLTVWDERQERIKRMLAEAEGLRGSKSPEGKMVSGWYVAPHWSQQLAPIINQVLGGYVQRQAMQQQQQLGMDMRKDAEQWMGAMPQESSHAQQGPVQNPGLPQTQEGAIDWSQQQGAQLPDVVQKPTQKDMLQWGQQGMTNPLTKAVAALSLKDTLIDDPNRRDAAAARAHEAALARSAKAEQFQQQMAQRIFELDMRLQDRALDRASREALQRESMLLRQTLAQQGFDVRRDIASQGFDLRRDLAAAQQQNKPPTAAQTKAQAELSAVEANVKGIDNAIEMLKASSGQGTGYVPGLIQDFIPGGQTLVSKVRTKEMNDSVQQLTYITDEIRHGRFGSALTKTEKNSAAQYLPSEYDDKDALIRKAEGLKKLIAANAERLQAQAAAPTAMGGGVSIPAHAPSPNGYAGGSRAAADSDRRAILERELQQPGLSSQDREALLREISRLPGGGPALPATPQVAPAAPAQSSPATGRVRKFNPVTGRLE